MRSGADLFGEIGPGQRARQNHADLFQHHREPACALAAAVAGGVSPDPVIWLALIYLGFRLIYWAVYYSGIGKVAGDPRTLAHVGGLLTNIVLAGAAISALV
jgi:uncharacterized MAPEG superfamily protein